MHSGSLALCAVIAAASAMACGTPSHNPNINPADTDVGDGAVLNGPATITSTLPGVALESKGGFSIARLIAPNLEVRVAANVVSCSNTTSADHLSIDFGGVTVGDYDVVKGYPLKTSLAGFQARAHACPASATPDSGPASPCHEAVRSGKVSVTRVDDPGGVVEGTFDVVFADGEVKGTFSAARCQ